MGGIPGDHFPGGLKVNAGFQNLHPIATLVFHINYYVSAVLKVLQGEALNASDKFSFDLPALTSEAGWQQLINKTLTEAALFAVQIEKLEEKKCLKILQTPLTVTYPALLNTRIITSDKFR